MFSSLRALLLLLATLQLTQALPSTPAYKQHATHHTRSLSNGLKIKTYHPKPSYEVYGRGLAQRDFQSTTNSTNFRDGASKFMHNKFGSADDDDDMEVSSEYDGPHASHVWFRQKVNGITVANTLANVALNNKGDVLSYSSNFVQWKKIGNSFAGGSTKGPNTTPKLSADEATTRAAKSLGGRPDSRRKPALEFLAVEDGSLKLTHAVRMHVEGHVVEAYIGAEDGEVLGLVDYTSDLDMRVVPIQRRDPTEGHELIKNVGIKASSPQGWNVAGDDTYQKTVGNNVLAAKGDPTVLSVDELVERAVKSSSENTFDFKFDPYADPSKDAQLDAATVNAWYVANMAHDILYQYGFTEKTFNFQDSNGDKGGKGGDVVFLSVQDESGTNNANFVTLPEGEPGLMRMYLWDAFNPMRDGDLANSVILHEYAHGLSNRLTGGGTAQCLQSTEARALGEGISDAFANWVWQTSSTHIRDFAIGSYVTGTEEGIRSHVYSTNRKVNPLTYADLKGGEEEHLMGEVWALALHNVHAGLVRQLGASKDALTNPDGDNGHAVFMHLFVDALALQPCNPSFPDARTAWIQADQNRYNGKHKCTLWLAFAYMGLGVDAKDYKNSIKLPAECPLPGKSSFA